MTARFWLTWPFETSRHLKNWWLWQPRTLRKASRVRQRHHLLPNPMVPNPMVPKTMELNPMKPKTSLRK